MSQALVIEVVDAAGKPTGQYYGMLGGTFFSSVDGSLDEANGWSRVKLSSAQFTEFYRRYLLKHRLNLALEPQPLAADGTPKK